MKKKRFNRKHGKDFREFQKPVLNAKELSLESISLNLIKEKVKVNGNVERIVQTKGPTIFIVSDGTGSLALKGFQKPGERAFPDIHVEDKIKAIVEIGEFDGQIEGEIKEISKLTNDESKRLSEKIEETQIKRAKVTEVSFLVKSSILDKLKDRFIKAATEIRKAIIQHRPIIVRHHNDTDGYSSGFALEKAILPL